MQPVCLTGIAGDAPMRCLYKKAAAHRRRIRRRDVWFSLGTKHGQLDAKYALG